MFYAMKLKVGKSMKNLSAVILIISMLCISGCSRDIQEEKPSLINPEINLNPIWMPTKKQPEITVEKEGHRFRWPGQDWFLMEDEAGIYALAQDLSFRLEIQPNHQQLQTTSILFQDETESGEAFAIHNIILVKEGILLTIEHDNGLYGLAHLHDVMSEQLEWLILESEEIPKIIISEDKSKVIYQKLPEGHLDAYHFATGRKTSFPPFNEDRFCNNWVEQVELSPLGAFL